MAGLSNVNSKSVLDEAGEPRRIPVFDVVGYWVWRLSHWRGPIYDPKFPMFTVATIEAMGQGGLGPSMAADVVPPAGRGPVGVQMAEQTVWAAWVPLALVRVRAKRAAPERARSLTKEMRSMQIVQK